MQANKCVLHELCARVIKNERELRKELGVVWLVSAKLWGSFCSREQMGCKTKQSMGEGQGRFSMTSPSWG